MKKLLFLMACGALATSVSAQRADKGIMFAPSMVQQVEEAQIYKPANVADVNRLLDINKAQGAARAASKGTAQGGSKWYDHYGMISAVNNDIFSTNANSFVWGMWFDTTVTQFYSGSGSLPQGYHKQNWSAMSQFVDPVTSKLFNDISFATDIQIKSFNTYQIDSINIQAAYVRMKTRPSSVVDTLYVSITPQGGSHYYMAKSDPTYGSKVATYTTADTARFCAPIEEDSVNNAAFPASTITGATRAFWKIPLTASMGDTPLASGSFTTRSFTFPVMNGTTPTPLNLPAGARFAITISFKSGDTWAANQDSLNSRHRFMPVTGHVNNGAMAYIRESYNDLSMSGMMFSGSPRFIPSTLIEIWNQPSMNYEYHNLSAHVVCSTCDLVGVNDVITNIARTAAYPNPASNQINVSFDLFERADVTVSLTNMMGQAVAAQSFKNTDKANVVFNTANLPAGVYTYTVDADGNRKTGRVVVAH